MSEPVNGYRKKNVCPYCNHHVDAALNPDNEKEVPIAGALSICIHCAKASIFNENMQLERFDMNTLDIDDHVFIVKMQYHIHHARGRYPAPKRKH